MRIEHLSNETETKPMEILREALRCERFQSCHRRRPQDFTRRRRLSFEVVMLLLLQRTVRSVQLHLNDFFDRIGQKLGATTSSAWTQAREKLRHTAFIELNQRAVVEVVYQPQSRFRARRWRTHRLLALDSSMLCLPNTGQLGREFGWTRWQNQKGACGRQVQARFSVLSDVLNRLALDSRLVSSKVGERALALEHLKCLEAQDITLMDRGYAGYELWARWIEAGRHFVGRCARGTFEVVDQLMKQNQSGQTLITTLSAPNGLMGTMRQQGLAQINVRFVTVRLTTGELEVLATNLMEQKEYPTELFGELYGYRWGIESYFSLLKGRLDLEHFSGRSLEAVLQDVYATVLLSNLETILSAPVQQQMNRPQTGAEARQVNRAVSFHTIKNHLMELLLSEEPLDEVVTQMQALFAGNPITKRPQRRPPRAKTSAWRSYRYHRSIRKRVF